MSYVRSMRWLALLLLTGCAFFRATPTPIPMLRYAAPAGDANALIVMLPGRGDQPDAYKKNGFVAKVQACNPHADIVCPDAHIGYYYNKSIVERLHEDVLAGARERYEQIWFIGISMGGMGTAAYAGEHPENVDGAILLAPYMGSNAVIEEVRAAGGPRSWTPPEATTHPLDSVGRFRQMWTWYRDVITQPDAPKLFLGYGAQDRFAPANAMVANELPKAQTMAIPGGHKWTTWKPLFDELATRALTDTGEARECRLPQDPPVSFAHDVLPLLSDRCFRCHGPDAKARKADLRLDDKDSVFGERDGGAVIVKGAPERSELMRRITATDDELMPPRDSHLQLSKNEIELLRRWIKQGAPWTTHWSFVPPETKEAATASIDTFVGKRLQQRGWQANAPAQPAALLRRVYLDLTGLPPTPAQLDAFLRDPSDASYERIVDELLASPHYGERMAWPWLEASRYADTDGYQADPTRTAWPWRDWLVRALNDNMPFDQFTAEVLAGDLIPDANQDQQLATGFLRNNAHNGEGGRISEETRIENIFDRTETVATVWMGLTFECARCHDHKYDPISQRDYYRLFSFFNQTSETGGGRRGGRLQPTMRYVGDVKKRARLLTVDAELAKLRRQLQQREPEQDAQQPQWQKDTAARIKAAHAAMQPARLSSWLRSQPFAPGRAGVNSMYAEAFAPERAKSITEGDEWQRDPSLVDGKPHVFAQGQYTTYFHRTIEAATARRMRVSLGSDDAIKVWCNGKLILANNARRGVAANQERAELPLKAGSNELLVKIINYGGSSGLYFRRVEETVAGLPSGVVQALRTAKNKRSAQQRRALQRQFRREQVPGYAARDDQLQALQHEQAALRGTGIDVSVMDELPPNKRRKTRILERGNYQQPQQVVQTGTPAFLPPLAGKPNRLALARWLVSGKHPLTARVAVNRAWQTFFGRGLVATTEDFGRQGDRASHPQLLDWLANDFVSNGWNVKRLHRQIVTSRTYRQSSAASANAFRDDPDNVLLGRSQRHRLPAWMLRDQALALSGKLAALVGGKPVNPYQPEGIWSEATFGTIRYMRGNGDDLYRRSLYVFWRRIVGPTVFFDTQTRQQCVVRRSITNTPLHALTTLNETGFVESARGLATRAFHAGDTADARITWLLRAAAARAPTSAEHKVLRARLDQSIRHFTDNAAAATQLLEVGDAAPDASIPAAELAGLCIIASIVLNLDEVLTRS